MEMHSVSRDLCAQLRPKTSICVEELVVNVAQQHNRFTNRRFVTRCL